MTRWAWVIDQTRCIGCHACTTACKSENDVAVGVFRTWVKNVEVGTFPEVKRHFAVLRCNHCEDPPCVEVCPVTAMYQRPDGLVDFDHDACIGCKACMQACPYDAIYMDPDSNTAAKCNFCSHRVDEGLLPACVVVCPEEALLFGDLEDPTSKVSRALKEHDVTVRRPEQGTKPHAFYIGAHDATLEPLAARHDATYMWSDRSPRDTRDRTPLPIYGSAPATPARVAYDVPRQRAWGWPVSSYIWTKGIAAGLGMLTGFAQYTNPGPGQAMLRIVSPILALVFLGFTGALLVGDLKRPERFWTILTRPQWRSWLARGAVIITVYGATLVAWLAFAVSGSHGGPTLIAPILIIAGAFTAGYTAPLLAQCEGRDLWQSRLLLPHLLVHALVGGLAVVIIVGAISGLRAGERLDYTFAGAALATGLIALVDAFKRHHTSNARAAARTLTRGAQSRLFWLSLVVGVALVVPLALAGGASLAVAAALALGGLWLHGHAFILAGQGPPIS
jgi:Fe-S-cluster-containing dehydrogenase component/formate-dependent nitrite reductase membrane component NrfD